VIWQRPGARVPGNRKRSRAREGGFMKKCYLVAAFAALLVSASANAEFVLGGDVGFVSTTGSAKDNANDFGDSGSSFGVFGQYVFALQPGGGGFGIHVGYANESGDMSSACTNDSTLKCSSFELKNTVDIMGVYRTAEFGGGWSGLLLAGYSRLKAELELEDNVVINSVNVGGRSKSATHGGYKLAAGVQKTFGKWSTQTQIQYADYGDETYTIEGAESKIDTSSLGLRFGVAYHF